MTSGDLARALGIEVLDCLIEQERRRLDEEDQACENAGVHRPKAVFMQNWGGPSWRSCVAVGI